ncbi:hypothetical protein TSOC_013685, partial [Tetrabaena socialis]
MAKGDDAARQAKSTFAACLKRALKRLLQLDAKFPPEFFGRDIKSPFGYLLITTGPSSACLRTQMGGWLNCTEGHEILLAACSQVMGLLQFKYPQYKGVQLAKRGPKIVPKSAFLRSGGRSAACVLALLLLNSATLMFNQPTDRQADKMCEIYRLERDEGRSNKACLALIGSELRGRYGGWSKARIQSTLVSRGKFRKDRPGRKANNDGHLDAAEDEHSGSQQSDSQRSGGQQSSSQHSDSQRSGDAEQGATTSAGDSGSSGRQQAEASPSQSPAPAGRGAEG